MSGDRNPMPGFSLPPALDDIAAMAERALTSIPPPFAEHVQDVGIAVEDRADDATLHELQIESAWELTGLYRGVPLTQRSVLDVVQQPDRIFLYREAILLDKTMVIGAKLDGKNINVNYGTWSPAQAARGNWIPDQMNLSANKDAGLHFFIESKKLSVACAASN